MTSTISLRSRLLIGSVFWTIGLVAVMNVVISMLSRLPGGLMHVGGLSVAALGLLTFGLVQVRSILSLFRRLQERLAAVREGREQRLDGRYPREVQPLVTDLNALLEHRADLVRRAIAKAGDLAHGLKTPLAVVGQEGERLIAAGQHEAGVVICQQVERMRRQIDYHLAHARAAASSATPGTSSRVLDSVEGLNRALSRLYAEKGVAIDVTVDPEHSVRAERCDLDEMLGNLLDNACKWAATRVRVESRLEPRGIVIVVDDDGPGIPADMRARVLQRGVRADQTTPGSGLGLAIVADLAEVYGGSVELGASPAGGVSARLTLPSCEPPEPAT